MKINRLLYAVFIVPLSLLADTLNMSSTNVTNQTMSGTTWADAVTVNLNMPVADKVLVTATFSMTGVSNAKPRNNYYRLYHTAGTTSDDYIRYLAIRFIQV